MNVYSADTVATDRYAKKKHAIVAAASEILNHQGVKGMTLADVAGRVGLVTTSMTYYFKKKEDLAVACFLSAIERFDRMADEALRANMPQERIHRFLDLWLEAHKAMRNGKEPPIAIFSDVRSLTDVHRNKVREASGPLFRKIRSLFDVPELAWFNADGIIARTRTRMLMEQIFWSVSWLRRYEVDDYPRVRDRLFDILVNGLAAPSATWNPGALPFGTSGGRDSQEMSRETFLIAATRLVNEQGYRGASVERISAVLNVTKGSFYHHNEAKDDLVVACFERTFNVMRQVQRLASEQPVNQYERLSATAATLVRYQLSDQGPLLRTSALSALPPSIRQEVVEWSDSISHRFAAMISDGIADGSIRPVDPFIAAQMLNATLNATAELRVLAPDIDPGEAVNLYAKPMLMGLFAR